MAKGDTLVLKANIYDQAQDDGEPPKTVHYEQGDTFKARTAEEYDRLTESEAAVDPKVENERQREDAERRIEQLQAEQDRLQEQIEETKAEGDLSSLTVPEIDSRLEAEGLDASGKKPEKVARLQAHLDAQG